MLCALFPAFSRLAVVPLMVWQLFTFLAEIPCNAAWRKTTGDFIDTRDFCYFTMVCAYGVGTHFVAGDPHLFADFYVANPGD